MALFCLLTLIGCSKVDLYYAEDAYKKIKGSQEPELIINALKVLVELDPVKYQTELESTQKAIKQLQSAQMYFDKSIYYKAYIDSHNSYRAFPINTSKYLLVKAGSHLKYISEVQANVIKSFKSLPEDIHSELSKYSQTPVLEWNLIEVNSVIEQLGNSVKLLNYSLAIIERQNKDVLFDEVEQWRVGIQQQVQFIKSIQMYIINIGLLNSAKKLDTLNQQLSEESANLLSLVREDLAQETMNPNFIKAINIYAPYSNININLSLASSDMKRNTHALWYEAWLQLEHQVLESTDDFSSYPQAFQDRSNKIADFINEAEKVIPDLTRGYLSFNAFMIRFELINGLIKKLHQDRMLINYGSSTN